MFNDLAATDNELEMHTNDVDRSVKHTCTKCNGTGHYRGVRIHQQRSDCFACKGKGYFMTSPEARAKAKAKRVEKKVQKEAEKAAKADAYKAEHSELFEFMKANCNWNGFFFNMLEAVHQYGRLTDGQIAAAYRSMEKIQAKQAEKAKSNIKVDLTKLNEVFSNASENGLKKPKLRIAELVISMAPSHGRNAGFLYVKAQGDYAGKISPEGVFYKTSSAPEGIKEELTEFCKNPMEAAIKYGRQTGQCACCGRELTNKASIELGIGPICAEKWF